MKILLTGNPNVGKTTLFNALTGAHNRTGNYHGVTVGVSEKNSSKRLALGLIADLPGLYSLDGMSMEEYMRKYEVPYLIWANYDLPQMELPTTSLNFLGQQLLRLAGIETTGYGEFLWGVQEILPAICFPGYTDAEGNAYSHLETNDFTPLIDAYQSFQYNNLFGGEDRLDALYEPELSAEAA